MSGLADRMMRGHVIEKVCNELDWMLRDWHSSHTGERGLMFNYEEAVGLHSIVLVLRDPRPVPRLDMAHALVTAACPRCSLPLPFGRDLGGHQHEVVCQSCQWTGIAPRSMRIPQED